MAGSAQVRGEYIRPGRDASGPLRYRGTLRPYPGSRQSRAAATEPLWRGPRRRAARRATVSRADGAGAVRDARADRQARFPRSYAPAMALDRAGTALDGGCHCIRTGGATLQPDDDGAVINAAAAPAPDPGRMGDRAGRRLSNQRVCRPRAAPRTRLGDNRPAAELARAAVALPREAARADDPRPRARASNRAEPPDAREALAGRRRIRRTHGPWALIYRWRPPIPSRCGRGGDSGQAGGAPRDDGRRRGGAGDGATAAETWMPSCAGMTGGLAGPRRARRGESHPGARSRTPGRESFELPGSTSCSLGNL